MAGTSTAYSDPRVGQHLMITDHFVTGGRVALIYQWERELSGKVER